MPLSPLLLSIEKIWDHADHNGLTDLILYKDEFYCTFREADTHYAGSNGIIRILKSSNGVVWNLVTTLEWEGWDLRDPKLSIMPDGRLLLLIGASQYTSEKVRLDHCSIVCFSDDGANYTPFTKLDLGEEWLWRLTWHHGVGYGISYFFKDPKDRAGPWGTKLYKTVNGIDYQYITEFPIPGHPNESTIRFLPNDQMVALVRRDGVNTRHAWIGSSFPPYEDWLWAEAHYHIGGPNFLILPKGQMIAAGRVLDITPYGYFCKTALFDMNLHQLQPILFVPSFGDCSYPGLVYQDPYLWMSYYSSHEGKSNIYLAKFVLN